ncbi:sodium/hydrogen exchanger 3 isoform X6 [Sitodiplosis mosellana]|uniref:sodium/hydrogen exchanger 3 isoform X6 n=1 Tax=Sitodiplosis mosellana TaxID=263140 RepID=UPI002443DB8D|nr:sodium/hydrogen exchanger 3 isoform X6 [Sitodiplosis mosellana]
MVLLPTNSPNDDDDEHDNETQHQLNSTAIDLTYCETTTTTLTINNTANCQSDNDVETFGLLRNCNGQTISINSKQTKMHHNATTIATLKRQQCHDSDHLENSNRTTPSGNLQQLYTGRFINSSSRHLNKMHLIAIILSYLLAFSIQSISARPNVDRNDDSTSNWQSVALTSENELMESSRADEAPSGFTKVQNEPLDSDSIIDHRSYLYPSISNKNESSETTVDDNDHSIGTPFIISVWILSASVAKIGFHKAPRLNQIFPESCLLIVIGVFIGVLLRYGTRLYVSPLTPNTFFLYMLPPIIFDAGYFMPNRLFFDHLGTILLMAVVGTIFNIFTIGSSLYACNLFNLFGKQIPVLDIFLFSSLIAAVDPVAVLAVFEEIHVNEILYIVVFGESLLNDAVTVVLYHMCETYNERGLELIGVMDLGTGVMNFLLVAVGGTVIGVIWGFMTGLVTRFTENVRVIEPIFIFIMAYLAYLNAEMLHLSGILSITFCGITMKNYVESNISQKSHTTIKYALKMMSSSSETIIFMFLGVATVNNRHDWNTVFIVLTIIFCSVYRTIGVIILSAIANRFRLNKLSRVDQFVMSYGGLRGAVAFALALLIKQQRVESQPMFVTTTIAVIYFTVFLQGITIKPLVKILNVKRANKKKPTMNERIHERLIDHLMAGMEDIVGKTGNYHVRDKFKRFDNKFIRPLILKHVQSAEPKILETYSKLTMKDAMDFMQRNPSTIGQMSGTESMSALFRNYTAGGGRLAPPFLMNTCPSFSNIENCSRNLDMQELDYNPSKKDLTDAKIHHLLAEELKPYKRASCSSKTLHRRLSYSRHAVDDTDLTTQQVNYKMHMNIRRTTDRKHHKRSKRGSAKEGSKQNHVSFPEFKQNGSAKQLSHDYINEVLNETVDDDEKQNLPDDWEEGLTFTARSSPEEDAKNNSSLLAHIANLPGFDASTARFATQYSTRSSPDKSVMEIVPTAAELMLPWRRDQSYHSFGDDDDGDDVENANKRLSKESEGETRVTTPTATETQLPWKRNEDNVEGLQQNEFPAWASNKEYLAYSSPSATFLGALSKPKQIKSVIGLFRRESTTSGSAAGSDPCLAAALTELAMTPSSTNQPSTVAGAYYRAASISGASSTEHHERSLAAAAARGDRRRSISICAVTPIDESSEMMGVDPLGALIDFKNNDRHNKVENICKNNRRRSLFELTGRSASEEKYSKSLPDRDSFGGGRPRPTQFLTKLTPKPHLRQLRSQTSSLLSSTSITDTSDEDDDDESEEIHAYNERRHRRHQ